MSCMRIPGRWSQYREQKQKQREKQATLVELIERMVQDSDPRIRKVSGYRQQLQKPVENALGYIEGLISSIPGPFSLSAERWDKDPLMHALFVSPDEIRSLLKNCVELKSFFKKSGVKTAVALLTATKKERTVFGTALEGEIIRRDVPQVAVEFYDHRVVAPVPTEEQNRSELVHRGLNLLATSAFEEIMQVQSLREELTAQHRVLELKLKMRQTRDRGLECLLAGGCGGDSEIEQAQELLAEIDKQLTKLGPGSGTPRDFLRKLENVLTAADNALKEKTLAMRLNWMGVKLNKESTDNSSEITLTELEIPGRLKRVAVLTNIAVNECLDFRQGRPDSI
jgi:hypothetical protein